MAKSCIVSYCQLLHLLGYQIANSSSITTEHNKSTYRRLNAIDSIQFHPFNQLPTMLRNTAILLFLVLAISSLANWYVLTQTLALACLSTMCPINNQQHQIEKFGAEYQDQRFINRIAVKNHGTDFLALQNEVSVGTVCGRVLRAANRRSGAREPHTQRPLEPATRGVREPLSGYTTAEREH
jgi:cAMP phosphodiesterase